jgi:DNA-binding transcriptional regulator YhcF (GntR family)
VDPTPTNIKAYPSQPRFPERHFTAKAPGSLTLVQRCYKAFMDLLSLDPESAVSPFEQVRAQIAAAIDTGVLAAASRLPTVRSLAADLGLATNTVARSHRELELAGLLETRGRQGTFVAGAPSERRMLATRAAREFTRRMR